MLSKQIYFPLPTQSDVLVLEKNHTVRIFCYEQILLLSLWHPGYDFLQLYLDDEIGFPIERGFSSSFVPDFNALGCL